MVTITRIDSRKTIWYTDKKELVVMEEKFGGITLDHVIQFQTRILFGAQYGRIELAKKEPNDEPNDEQIIIACLRMGWNDAFRHVTENQADVENEKKNHLEKNTDELKDEFCVCGRNHIVNHKRGCKSYDDYYSSILSDPIILEAFRKYASAETTDDKCAAITGNLDDLFGALKEAKKIDNCDNPAHNLCFGHIQKMFNIAVKLYLCVYMCRKYLGLDEKLFDTDIVYALQHADCPIDSIILDRFEQIGMEEAGVGQQYNKKYPGFVWSQINSEDKINTYKKIQDDFREEIGEGKSSLYFDFTHWN